MAAPYTPPTFQNGSGTPLSASVMNNLANAALYGITGCSAEKTYWQKRAAMLDPNACQARVVQASTTVPAGEVWLVWSAWKVKLAGVNLYNYIRHIDGDDSWLALPEGTTVDCSYDYGGGQGAALGYQKFDANLLATESLYIDDPKRLYYERLEVIDSTPINVIGGAVTDTVTNHEFPFPGGVTQGVITSSSVFDVAWNALLYAGNGQGALIMHPEVSDDAPIRLATPHRIAFNTSVITGMSARGAGLGTGTVSLTYVNLTPPP